jgi:hypothetical protein
MPGKRPLSTARRIGVTALFAAAALASGTTAAHAAVTAPAGSAALASPSNCSVTVDWTHSTVTARCTSGSGEYRAYTRCNAILWPDYNRYGAWTRVGSGGKSTASCDEPDQPFNYGVQVR